MLFKIKLPIKSIEDNGPNIKSRQVSGIIMVEGNSYRSSCRWLHGPRGQKQDKISNGLQSNGLLAHVIVKEKEESGNGKEKWLTVVKTINVTSFTTTVYRNKE